MAIHVSNQQSIPPQVLRYRSSTVGEPSLAVSGDSVLYTGNWYAARSPDAGRTWTGLKPEKMFPNSDLGFCCDQSVLYAPKQDLFLWLLQYEPGPTGNRLRLAATPAPEVEKDAWNRWDLVPRELDPAWDGHFFDYSHLALSEGFLYVVTQVYQVSDQSFTSSVAFRISLDSLVPGSDLDVTWFETDDDLLRATHGATDTMYFARHVADLPARLLVHRWPETAASPTTFEVEVSEWRGGNGYCAPGPDHNNWLSRCDPRITAGWLADGLLGFAWTVDRQRKRRQPHVRVALIDENSLTLHSEPDLWHPDLAYAWPSVCPNLDGEVGIAVCTGGGAQHPGHAVGVLDPASGNWDLRTTAVGTDGPDDYTWGDYLACRPAHPASAEWVCSGYVLRGGSGPEDVQPFLVQFGRS